jgi:hypothetical protein
MKSKKWRMRRKRQIVRKEKKYSERMERLSNQLLRGIDFSMRNLVAAFLLAIRRNSVGLGERLRMLTACDRHMLLPLPELLRFYREFDELMSRITKDLGVPLGLIGDFRSYSAVRAKVPFASSVHIDELEIKKEQ